MARRSDEAELEYRRALELDLSFWRALVGMDILPSNKKGEKPANFVGGVPPVKESWSRPDYISSQAASCLSAEPGARRPASRNG